MTIAMNLLSQTLARGTLAAAAAFAGVGAIAATAVPAAPAASAPAPHLIKGFRSAQFGMSEDQVRAAIAHDFAPADGAVTEFDNAVEKTKVIALHLGGLEPAPGVVNITYLFGASSHRLMHVNVVWSTGPAPTTQERAALADGGVRLANYFRQLAWRRGSTTATAAPDASYAVLFAGVDPKNEAVEVRLTGVVVHLKDGTTSAPTGPATLRVAYFATTGQPDTAEVKTGSF